MKRLDRFPLSILLLLFRICVGAVFWNSGLTKLANWDSTLLLFRYEYAVPLLPPHVAAILAAGIELACPMLLFLGLFARIATLPMLAMTAVIEVFVYPDFWLEHLTWAALLLAILTRGAGAISLDAVIGRVWKTSL